MSERKTRAGASFSLPVLDTAPSYKRVATLIEREIISGRVKPGELLPTEGDLAAQLGVHRSTIREGIRSLENSGLIRRVGGKRLVVSIPDRSAVAWSTTRALGLRKVSFRELWEVQMEMEPFSASLAAQRVSEEIQQEIAANVDALAKNIDDDEAVIELDIEFHRLLAKASKNQALMLSLEPIGILLFSATVDLYKKVPPARHRLLHAHRIIADAVFARDEETARTWMAKHIRDFRRGYIVAGTDLDAPIEIHDKVPPIHPQSS
mgnify:CR=1 FL=1